MPESNSAQEELPQDKRTDDENKASVHINAGDLTGSAFVVGDHNVINVGALATPKPDVPTAPGSLPPGSYLPFTRNALFTGREANLKQLETSLLGEHAASTLISQAVLGMGGIGKTQLAVEFAFRYGYKFKGVHWLDLHDPSTLDAQIAQCGTEMMLPDWPREQPEQVLLTLAAWKRDGPRLLLLDNFEEPAVGGKVLARLQDPNVRILITSRRSDWPTTLGLHPLALEVFSPEESIEFLRKYTGDRFTGEQLQKLADRLGYLALALELAGRYFEKHTRLTVEEYLKRLEIDHESMRGFRKELPIATGHDLDLLSTFSLSWEQVQEGAAQKAFKIAGYCAPNTPIPNEIFEQTLELDQTACDDALNQLQGLGLLNEGPAIHPLLAEYARYLDRNKVLLTTLTDKLADIANARNDEEDRTGHYSLYTPFLPHIRSVGGFAETVGMQLAGSLWNSLGHHIGALADYVGARAAFERALRIDEATFGPDHPYVARHVNKLGTILRDLGDLPGARTAFERALKIDEAAFGPDHPNVATDVNNLGTVLRDLGDYVGARTALERALKIDEAAFGPDHPNVSKDINNLGTILRDLGDYVGARTALERALKIDEAVFGPDHPNVAVDVDNLGGVLRALGDLPGARTAIERALKIDEAVFGPDHPNVAMDVDDLGGVLRDLGDLPGARTAFERALKIDEAAFGLDHPNVAIRVNNLGSVLRDLGDLPGARTAFERALKVDEAAFGPDHPMVALRLWNLGTVFQAQGDPANARKLYERALRIFRQSLPESHPHIKLVEGNLRSLEVKGE